MSTVSFGGSTIDVFYAYSHRDEDLRDELDKHLSSLRREGLIANWHDRRIGAGNEFKNQIDEHLNESHIILLLVSVDFLHSNYCYDIEMQRALERHEAKEARVIPIILRACDWTHAPFSKLLTLPEDGVPVTRRSNRDEAFAGVAHGIRKVIEELMDAVQAPRTRPLRNENEGSNSRNLILLPAQLVPNQSAILIGKGYTNGGTAEINDGSDTSSVLIDGDSTGLKASGGASDSRINEGSKITINYGGNWSASIVIPIDTNTITPGAHEFKVTDDQGSEGVCSLTILERTLALSPPESEPGNKVDVFGSGGVQVHADRWLRNYGNQDDHP